MARGKFILFFIQGLIFAGNGFLAYWRDSHPQITLDIQFSVLAASFLICFILTIVLIREDDDSSFGSGSSLTGDPKIKQKALQIVYNDIKTQNWAGFISHLRDPKIPANLKDYAIISAHPTKAYAKFATKDYELKISGYDSKNQVITRVNNRESVESIREPEKFQSFLKELLTKYLKFYDEWMIDPVGTVEEFKDLLLEDQVYHIFRTLPRYAQAFDKHLFTTKYNKSKLSIQMKSKDKSSLTLLNRGKKYHCAIKMVDKEVVRESKWSLDENGVIVKQPNEEYRAITSEFLELCLAILQN